MTRTTYTKELLQEAADASSSIMGVMRYLGLKQAGGTHTHISRKLKTYEIDTTHFRAVWNKGIPSSKKKTTEQILIVLPSGSNRPKINQLRRAMVEVGIPYQCSCGNTGEWQDKLLTLEVDHIDGNWLDNRKENLRFLCPNCHSQEETTNKPHKYRQSI